MALYRTTKTTLHCVYLEIHYREENSLIGGINSKNYFPCESFRYCGFRIWLYAGVRFTFLFIDPKHGTLTPSNESVVACVSDPTSLRPRPTPRRSTTAAAASCDGSCGSCHRHENGPFRPSCRGPSSPVCGRPPLSCQRPLRWKDQAQQH